LSQSRAECRRNEPYFNRKHPRNGSGTYLWVIHIQTGAAPQSIGPATPQRNRRRLTFSMHRVSREPADCQITDASDFLSTSPTILLDAHVHLHGQFDSTVFLDSARANFRAAAIRTCRPGSVGSLWLTDTPEERSFRRLHQAVQKEPLKGWSLSYTAEPTSLVASHQSGDTLLLLAGRQISTRERLEVLALGSETDFPAGQSLIETLTGVRKSGAIAVIPWGFGKWWFRRHRLVAAALTSSPVDGLFIGDNGGRPRAIRRPRLFELATACGIYNLPGSDPLPLRWEISKPGRLGVVLEGPMDFSRPTASLVRMLLTLRAQPPLFGSQESFGAFVKSQIGLRLPWRPARDPAQTAGGN
jgi:hypothetical protein